MSLTYGFTLSPADSSEDFSNAFRALAGDGVTPYGARFALTVNGFTATLGSGYALAAGRFVKNGEPLALAIQASGSSDGRTDALAVRVDREARRASLEVLADVDRDKLPGTLRKEGVYSILLYLIRVRRGSTSLSIEDVTDFRADGALCGTVVPLSAVSGDVLYIYQFLTSGIDRETARLIGLSNQVIARADAAIPALDTAIRQAGGGAEIGELMTGRLPPSDPGWLLCDGSAVPAAYPALSAALGGVLPALSRGEDRYRIYIYGGAPAP